MDEIFMRTWTLPEWLGKKYFKEKDYYSIEELISLIEKLDEELDEQKEKYKDLKENLECNYKPINQREAIGYDEKSW